MSLNVGEVRTANGGEQYEVVEIKSSCKSTGGVLIRFLEGGCEKVVDAKEARNGCVSSKAKTRIKPGDVYGRLTVTERASPKGDRNTKWLCECVCGTTCTPTTIALTSGHTLSCGCYRDEMAGKYSITHGKTGTKEYVIWASMKQRCYDPNKDNYHRYGARGIAVCDEWKDSFEQFYADMGECPEGLTLERSDPNGNYCKENCVWANRNMQGFNTNMHSSNTTGRTGVYYNKRQEQWTAAIGANSRLIHLGTFNCYEDAVEARQAAELLHYGFNKE